jgi:lipoprotein-releasing system permease protein
LFLALRYLKPKRTFLSIITLISVIGVMLGVTVLILVIAVMTGFDRELRQKVIDFDAHILVTSEDVFRDWRALKAKIDKTPGVVATAPFVQGPVIVEFHNRRLAPLIRGIDPEQEEKVIPLRKFIKFGKLDLEGDSTVLEWSADDPESVRAAAEAMQREVQDGYTAVLGGEGRHEPVDDLPADADVVILTMPMGGG